MIDERELIFFLYFLFILKVPIRKCSFPDTSKHLTYFPAFYCIEMKEKENKKNEWGDGFGEGGI